MQTETAGDYDGGNRGGDDRDCHYQHRRTDRNLRHRQRHARDQASFQARTDARNALELFRYASGEGDFPAEKVSQFKPVTQSGTTYTVDYGWCNLTVTADFVQSRFTARAVNNKGDVLFEVNNYEK